MARNGNIVVVYTQGEIVRQPFGQTLETLLRTRYWDQVLGNKPLEEGIHEDILIGAESCRFKVEVLSDGTGRLSVIPRRPGVVANVTLLDGTVLSGNIALYLIDEPWHFIPCADRLPDDSYELWGFVFYRPNPPLVA